MADYTSVESSNVSRSPTLRLDVMAKEAEGAIMGSFLYHASVMQNIATAMLSDADPGCVIVTMSVIMISLSAISNATDKFGTSATQIEGGRSQS